jgi:hypothetical protein
MLLFLIWIPLLFPVIEFERIQNIAAIKRAIALAYRKMWRVVGIILLLTLIYMVVYLALFALIMLGALLFQPEYADFEALFMTSGFVVFNNLLAVLLMPLFPLLGVWLYFDIRARVDGDDLALPLEQNGEVENDPIS